MAYSNEIAVHIHRIPGKRRMEADQFHGGGASVYLFCHLRSGSEAKPPISPDEQTYGLGLGHTIAA